MSYNMPIQFPLNISLTDQVVEIIENQIINKELNVGDKLPTENELAIKYKVSRTVIREAIKILKEKGWVETFIAKGTFVVLNTKKGVRSSFDNAIGIEPKNRFDYLIQVRLIFEPEIAALSALRANEEEIAKMKRAISMMEEALLGEKSIDKFLQNDFTFHITMAESTGNPLIPMILNPVFSLLRDVQEFHLLNVEEGDQKSQHHHRLIMNSIEKHDPSAARLHMYNHIVQLRTDIETLHVIKFDVDRSIKNTDSLPG